MSGHIQTAKSTSWNTPEVVLIPTRKVFDGTIDLDPCSNDGSIVGATTSFTLPQDGLKESWWLNFKTIFVNPPYGRDTERGTSIADWIRKCSASSYPGGPSVIALIPSAVDTKVWHEVIFKDVSAQKAAVCFWKGRLTFLGGKACAPFATSIVYWGQNQAIFRYEFEKHGFVIGG